ncbi:MAG: histidine kinase [Holophagaceae bacterium]|nr:histidine kinase [Holophagaceae bacterium]
MTAADLIQSTVRRFQRPAAWAMVLGFQVLWVPSRLLAGVPWERMGAWEFFVPALFLLGHLALAPLPWQWSGDGRREPPLWRGALQAVPWNLAWVLLLLLVAQDLVQPARPRREGARGPASTEGDVRPRDREPQRGPWPRQEWIQLFVNFPFAVVLGWFLAEKERVERDEDDLRNREREARAAALQSQLHPHALFNVLGGLTELVHEDPDAAEEALVGLTELLRMLLRHGSALALPLGQERKLVERYLEIEAIRLGPRLTVEWAWDPALDGRNLPPLLIQPLVENAIKHGISPHPEGGRLRIQGSLGPEGFHFRVANTGQPLGAVIRDGTGLGNLRQRLALLPGPPSSLSLLQEGDWTVADLRLGATLGT